MSGGIPDAGSDHIEAADGAAFNGAVGQGIAELLLEIITARGSALRICDLGCGNGHLAGRLGALGYTVVGVDASDTYLQTASRIHSGSRVTFINSLIDAGLPAKLAGHGPFDLVVSSEVIEHLYDPDALAKAAAAVLRPGGVAVISTPYHGYLKNIAISATNKWDAHHGVHWHGGHIKFFSVETLSAMLRAAGFDTPTFRYYGRMPLLWKSMVAMASKPQH